MSALLYKFGSKKILSRFIFRLIRSQLRWLKCMDLHHADVQQTVKRPESTSCGLRFTSLIHSLALLHSLAPPLALLARFASLIRSFVPFHSILALIVLSCLQSCLQSFGASSWRYRFSSYIVHSLPTHIITSGTQLKVAY